MERVEPQSAEQRQERIAEFRAAIDRAISNEHRMASILLVVQVPKFRGTLLEFIEFLIFKTAWRMSRSKYVDAMRPDPDGGRQELRGSSEEWPDAIVLTERFLTERLFSVEKLQKIRSADDPFSYLSRMVRHFTIDYLRSKAPTPRFVDVDQPIKKPPSGETIEATDPAKSGLTSDAASPSDEKDAVPNELEDVSVLADDEAPSEHTQLLGQLPLKDRVLFKAVAHATEFSPEEWVVILSNGQLNRSEREQMILAWQERDREQARHRKRELENLQTKLAKNLEVLQDIRSYLDVAREEPASAQDLSPQRVAVLRRDLLARRKASSNELQALQTQINADNDAISLKLDEFHVQAYSMPRNWDEVARFLGLLDGSEDRKSAAKTINALTQQLRRIGMRLRSGSDT